MSGAGGVLYTQGVPMIDGVLVKPLTTHADARGYFREIARADDAGFPGLFGQLSAALVAPGVIKAFHWHERQDDLWYVAQGRVHAVLYDRRQGSPTAGMVQSLRIREDEPCALVVPRGVAHGYKVLGTRPALLIYLTTAPYDRAHPDEQRISHDDPAIGVDWASIS